MTANKAQTPASATGAQTPAETHDLSVGPVEILRIPELPSIPGVGEIYLMQWSLVFEALLRGVVTRITIERIRHFRGFQQAICRSAQIHSRKESPWRVVARLIARYKDGRPIRWELRRVAEADKARRIHFEIEPPTTARDREAATEAAAGRKRRKRIPASPWRWCKAQAEAISAAPSTGPIMLEVGPSPIAADILAHWFYQVIYRILNRTPRRLAPALADADILLLRNAIHPRRGGKPSMMMSGEHWLVHHGATGVVIEISTEMQRAFRFATVTEGVELDS